MELFVDEDTCALCLIHSDDHGPVCGTYLCAWPECPCPDEAACHAELRIGYRLTAEGGDVFTDAE